MEFKAGEAVYYRIKRGNGSRSAPWIYFPCTVINSSHGPKSITVKLEERNGAPILRTVRIENVVRDKT